MESRELVRLLTEFATAFVANNPTRLDEIPMVFETAMKAALSIVQRLPGEGVQFGTVASSQGATPVASEPSKGSARAQQPVAGDMKGNTLKPAVPVAESIHDAYIVCLEDGRRMKTLKKHLGAKFNMTPDEYRAKWGLPPDYPMVCAEFSRVRSALTKRNEVVLRDARRKAISDRQKRRAS